ncbi:hypothetical protein GNP84_13665 [Aliivibrio fischeri]|uniref:hypothetical protein n=1 Tax=Aliivibrio fischeri TaxID=668 RepID=UPI0012D9EB8F|nr:hypothetical protein [Aliivibrio fischeri]MUK77930.1 hypothetical protein [Aliivibrio fischeri]
MARKLRLKPNLFLNMDHIVSWFIGDDTLRIDTSAETFHIGINGTKSYAEIFVTDDDLERIQYEIEAYFD